MGTELRVTKGSVSRFWFLATLPRSYTRAGLACELGHRSLTGRSGIGAYAGAARRRVHLATVPRPSSGHRPGRRQARHARILKIELHLTQP